MFRVRRTVAILLLLIAVERPVRIVEGKLLLLAAAGVRDGGRRTIHGDDDLGIASLFSLVKRAGSNGDLESKIK